MQIFYDELEYIKYTLSNGLSELRTPLGAMTRERIIDPDDAGHIICPAPGFDLSSRLWGKSLQLGKLFLVYRETRDKDRVVVRGPRDRETNFASFFFSLPCRVSFD